MIISTPLNAHAGDSGGPILLDGGSAAQDAQVGLVSWGKAVRCGTVGKPGVYTNLSYAPVRDFLRKHVPELFKGASFTDSSPSIADPEGPELAVALDAAQTIADHTIGRSEDVDPEQLDKLFEILGNAPGARTSFSHVHASPRCSWS